MDSILAQAARRLRFDAKVGTPDYHFKIALAGLLDDLDNGYDPDGYRLPPPSTAETVAKEVVYLSDVVSSYNTGAIV